MSASAAEKLMTRSSLIALTMINKNREPNVVPSSSRRVRFNAQAIRLCPIPVHSGDADCVEATVLLIVVVVVVVVVDVVGV